MQNKAGVWYGITGMGKMLLSQGCYYLLLYVIIVIICYYLKMLLSQGFHRVRATEKSEPPILL